jgi:DNA-binding response OmpR family regulator
MNEPTHTALRGNILVVDDATPNLRFLTSLLTEHGYTVFPASDGELALEFARTSPPDLILLDIRMPGMDGFEVCRRLKEERRTEGIPIIFISILEDEDDKVKGFRAGAVDYVTKPFQPEEVLARIGIHLRLKGLTENLEQTVTARTAELYAVNTQLQHELAERKQAEQVTQARFRMLEKAYAAAISLEDVLTMMLNEIEAQTGSSIAFYHFLKEDQQTLSLQSWSSNTLATMCRAEGKGSHYQMEHAGVWADSVRERRPVIHNDYASLPHRRGMPEGHTEVMRELVVPIFRGQRIVAIIGVGNKADGYTETDVQTVSLLGDFSWEIVERKRTEENLRTLNEELEQRVTRRTSELAAKNTELERMNKMFVGRELRMIELKERVKELEDNKR